MPNTKENIARFRQRRRENYQMMRQAGLDAKTAQALKNRKRETIEDLCKLLMDDGVTLTLKHKRSTLMSMSDHVAFHGLNAVLLLTNYEKRWPWWNFWQHENSLEGV